jgi:hypothetical protein
MDAFSRSLHEGTGGSERLAPVDASPIQHHWRLLASVQRLRAGLLASSEGSGVIEAVKSWS